MRTAHLLAALLLVTALSTGCFDRETLQVGSVRLPVVTSKPTEDRVFVVRAAERLADEYRAQLLAGTPDQWERSNLLASTRVADTRYRVEESESELPPVLIRVRSDRTGRLFLYQPCDGSSHARYLFDGGSLMMLGGEPLSLPILAVHRKPGSVVLVFDTTGAPPFVPGQLEFEMLAFPGLYRVGATLMMVPERAAALDLVVNQCRQGKVREFAFD